MLLLTMLTHTTNIFNKIYQRLLWRIYVIRKREKERESERGRESGASINKRAIVYFRDKTPKHFCLTVGSPTVDRDCVQKMTLVTDENESSLLFSRELPNDSTKQKQLGFNSFWHKWLIHYIYWFVLVIHVSNKHRRNYTEVLNIYLSLQPNNIRLEPNRLLFFFWTMFQPCLINTAPFCVNNILLQKNLQ